MDKITEEYCDYSNYGQVLERDDIKDQRDRELLTKYPHLLSHQSLDAESNTILANYYNDRATKYMPRSESRENDHKYYKEHNIKDRLLPNSPPRVHLDDDINNLINSFNKASLSSHKPEDGEVTDDEFHDFRIFKLNCRQRALYREFITFNKDNYPIVPEFCFDDNNCLIDAEVIELINDALDGYY